MKKLFGTIVRWLGATKILAVFRKYAKRILIYYYYRKNMVLVFYDSNKPNGKTFKLIQQIKKETEMLLDDLEAYQIYTAVIKTEKIAGDIAEVGVYKGGSAKLICEARGGKPVHLFDTFEGLPDLCELDSSKQFHKGDYSAPFESVKDYLKNYPNVYFYKVLFPSTTEPVENKRFSFVHLDVDLYGSTLNCLKFFYPKMNKGGVIISHDYPSSEGVKKAFDEFFSDKPELVIDLLSYEQCLIVKA